MDDHKMKLKDDLTRLIYVALNNCRNGICYRDEIWNNFRIEDEANKISDIYLGLRRGVITGWYEGEPDISYDNHGKETQTTN